MKKRLSFLLVLSIMLSLFAVFSTTALAGDFSYTVGESVNWCIEQVSEQNGINSVTVNSGRCPGISVVKNAAGDAVFISGTPSEAGTFSISYTITYNNGRSPYTGTLNFVIKGQDKPVSASYNATVGKDMGHILVYDSYGQLDPFTETWNGITFHSGTYDGVYGAYLEGTPTAEGSHTFTPANIDDGSTYNVTFSVAVTVTKAELKVTKSPTGETVNEGDSALFISSAENYSKIEWRIVTADGNNCWRNEQEIVSQFPGLGYYAYKNQSGQECLSLSNIPYSMNGYYVQTKFWSSDESTTAFTTDHSALITVQQTTLNKPTITAQPAGDELAPGKTLTLYISATSTEGMLHYQWYSNTVNSSAGGTKIEGATSASYTVPQTEGTLYYYCEVWITKDGHSSDTTCSSVAAVTYAVPVTPTPEPTATPEPSPEVSESPTPTDVNTNDKSGASSGEKKDHTVLFVIAGLLAVLLICASVVFLVLVKWKREDEAAGGDYEEYDAEYADEDIGDSVGTAEDADNGSEDNDTDYYPESKHLKR